MKTNVECWMESCVYCKNKHCSKKEIVLGPQAVCTFNYSNGATRKFIN